MLRTFMLFKPFRKEDYKDNDVFTMLLHRIRQLMISKHPKDEKDSVKRCSAHHRKLCFLELYRDAHGGEAPELPPLVIPEDTGGLPAVLEQLHKDAVRLTPIDYAFGEREHARWYIERWLQGTRYGDNNIDKNIPPEQRTNPCMLSWYDLEEDIILRDTEFLPRYQVAKAIEKCDRLLQAVNTVFTDF